jgi:hypothetical protein
MLCVVCGKNIELKLIDDGGMHPYCSPACGTKWRTRNGFLFNLKEQKTPLTGEQAIGLMMQRGFLDDDLSALNRVAKLSTTLRPLAKEHELGDAFRKPAVHMQQVMQDVPVHKTSHVKTGREFLVEKPSQDGSKLIRHTVDETRPVVTTSYKRLPVLFRKDITATEPSAPGRAPPGPRSASAHATQRSPAGSKAAAWAPGQVVEPDVDIQTTLRLHIGICSDIDIDIDTRARHANTSPAPGSDPGRADRLRPGRRQRRQRRRALRPAGHSRRGHRLRAAAGAELRPAPGRDDAGRARP